MNEAFQRIARRDKKAFLSYQCKEIEENNRTGKTRDLFKRIRDTKGTFHVSSVQSVQSLSCVQLFVTPWTAARQASLSTTNSWSLLKLMSIESVIKVLELGADYWKRVNAFVLQKRISVSDGQLKALKYAVRIPVQIPSAYQSIQLLALLENARANGFGE